MINKRDQIRSTVAEMAREQNNSGRYGIIQSYDPRTNTATILLSSTDSDEPADIVTDVMCPVIMGLQTVAPDVGRPCWVLFKGTSNDKKAVISHYFNHRFDRYDYSKQYNTTASLPKFMLGL